MNAAQGSRSHEPSRHHRRRHDQCADANTDGSSSPPHQGHPRRKGWPPTELHQIPRVASPAMDRRRHHRHGVGAEPTRQWRRETIRSADGLLAAQHHLPACTFVAGVLTLTGTGLARKFLLALTVSSDAPSTTKRMLWSPAPQFLGSGRAPAAPPMPHMALTLLGSTREPSCLGDAAPRAAGQNTHPRSAPTAPPKFPQLRIA